MIYHEFPECIHINEVFNDSSPLDISIWEYAKNNNMTIVTIDNDFNILSKFYNTLPKVIHLQIHNEPNRIVAEILVKHADLIKEFIISKDHFLFEINTL